MQALRNIFCQHRFSLPASKIDPFIAPRMTSQYRGVTYSKKSQKWQVRLGITVEQREFAPPGPLPSPCGLIAPA